MKINDEGRVQAVHDDQLQTLLDNLQISSKMQKGEMKCKFCRTIVSFENLAAIFPEIDTIKVVCGEPKCFLELTNYINGKNV